MRYLMIMLISLGYIGCSEPFDVIDKEFANQDAQVQRHIDNLNGY